MQTTVTITGVSDDVLARLRGRADRNQRSLNDELVAALQAVADDDLIPVDAAKMIWGAGARSPGSAVALVRLDRSGGDLLGDHLDRHWDSLARWLTEIGYDSTDLPPFRRGL